MPSPKPKIEDIVGAALAEATGVAPEREHEFHPTRKWRIDLAYVEIKLAIELDGYQYHSRRASQRNDAEKQNALVEAGWRVLRYPAGDLFRDAVRQRVVEQIHRVLCEVNMPSEAAAVLSAQSK